MGTNNAEIGMNRTGIGTAAKRAKAMVEATEEFPTESATTDLTPIAMLRELYARDADPMGSVPPPSSVRGVLQIAADALSGNSPTLLLDKLGERLAFERTGTRLYEGIRGKLEHAEGFPGAPTLEQIEEILLQEHAHFRLVEDLIKQLGADPTVVTPSANLHLTMSAGIVAVVLDPRTSLAQCLEAALLAELADNAGWEVLLQLLINAGHEDVTDSVQQALTDESEHLALVKQWLARARDDA